jgi:hypothetical protein
MGKVEVLFSQNPDYFLKYKHPAAEEKLERLG